MKTSVLYFLLLCIPARLLLAYLPQILSKTYLKLYSFIVFLIGASFLYLYFNNFRLNAFEAGGVTWWKDFRLVHGALYLTAAFYLFNEERKASVPLLTDTLLGFILFINHRFIK